MLNDPIKGKFTKKSIPIEVLEATCSDDLFKTKIRWKKTCIDGGEVYNELHDSWIKFKFGDFFNVTSDKDIYPIERKVFYNTYSPLDETSCDCLDVHQNLDLTDDTCGCPCHGPNLVNSEYVAGL